MCIYRKTNSQPKPHKTNQDKNKITAVSLRVTLDFKSFEVLLEFASPHAEPTYCKSVAQKLF